MTFTIWTIFTAVVFAGCGKNSPQNILDSPSPPAASEPDQSTGHHLYIIGGQSNGGKLLLTLHGGDATNDSDADYTLPVEWSVGYARGGTAISQWLVPDFNAELLRIVSDNCSQNPYLLWWQGESDSYYDLTPTFKEKTEAFFSTVKQSCPSITIIETVIQSYGLTPEDPGYNPEYAAGRKVIQSIQSTIGDERISSDGYKMHDFNHLSVEGFHDFWNAFTVKFPLEPL